MGVTTEQAIQLIDATHNNGIALNNILIYIQVFLVIIGIFIAYKGAMYVYKGIIMQTIRSYIKFKW